MKGAQRLTDWGLWGTRPRAEARPAPDVFLPDFCAIPVIFSVVIIGELLAFILVVAGVGEAPGRSRLGALAFVSLFVQWVGLASALVLCPIRRWLDGASDAICASVAFVVVLTMTAVTTEIAVATVGTQSVSSLLVGSVSRTTDDLASAHIELLVGNLTISAIVVAVALRYFYVQYQWRHQLERESTARIQALQSRIRPHFLFNSMNTIASFTRSDPVLAEQIVEALADLFRMSLSDAKVPSPLRRELDLCRQYIQIEQARLGGRLTVNWSVDTLPGDALLPALTLQPLIENAVYHGIEPSPTGGEIQIVGIREGEQLKLVLTNSVSSDAALGDPVRVGHQMALGNVTERIEAFFGRGAKVTTEARDGSFKVELVFPYVQRQLRSV